MAQPLSKQERKTERLHSLGVPMPGTWCCFKAHISYMYSYIAGHTGHAFCRGGQGLFFSSLFFYGTLPPPQTLSKTTTASAKCLGRYIPASRQAIRSFPCTLARTSIQRSIMVPYGVLGHAAVYSGLICAFHCRADS